jgi:hypothetical protein
LSVLLDKYQIVSLKPRGKWFRFILIPI